MSLVFIGSFRQCQQDPTSTRSLFRFLRFRLDVIAWCLWRLLCLHGVCLWIGLLLRITLILEVWMPLPCSALFVIWRLKTITICFLLIGFQWNFGCDYLDDGTLMIDLFLLMNTNWFDFSLFITIVWWKLGWRVFSFLFGSTFGISEIFGFFLLRFQGRHTYSIHLLLKTFFLV